MSKSIGGKQYSPQTLDETLVDLKRIGKGLLVGETADILGLPADLMGLYYDLRYGETPEGIQSLIDTVGSEALAKKFMGEEFPEFGMNLESAGRVMAPGALLTKAIASARIAARLKDTLPPGGGIGDLATETVGGAGFVDDVPQTTGEQLMMTSANNIGGGARKQETDDGFFKSDIGVISNMNKNREVFSNLLDELENIGEKNGALWTKIERRQPLKNADGRVRKDSAGNVLFSNEPGKVSIKGIDFNKPQTGQSILNFFENIEGKGLKGGLQSRLGKEAVESGLIRYLENNLKKPMTKDELVDVTRLFTPSVGINVYRKSELDSNFDGPLQDRFDQLTGELSSLPDGPEKELKKKELTVLGQKIGDYRGANPWTYDGVQLIRVDGGSNQKSVERDVFTFIFNNDDGHRNLIGKGGEEARNLSDKQKASLDEIESYLEALGSSKDLRKLNLGHTHGYSKRGYFGHVRGTVMDIKDPNTGEVKKSLVISEVQSNQAGMKEKVMNRLDKKQLQRLAELAQKSKTGQLTPQEKEQFGLLQSKTGLYGDELLSDVIRTDGDFQFVDDAGQYAPGTDMMTNSRRMDILQIVEEDKKAGTGFVDFAKKRDVLAKKAKEADEVYQQKQTAVYELDSQVTPLKRAMFKMDEEIVEAEELFEDFKLAKNKIMEDIINSPSFNLNVPESATGMNRILAGMFHMNEYDGAAHYPGGLGLTDADITSVFNPPDNVMLFGSTKESLKKARKRMRDKYGTKGNIDILIDVFGKGRFTERGADEFNDTYGFVNSKSARSGPGNRSFVTSPRMLKEFYKNLVKAYEDGSITGLQYNNNSGMVGQPTYAQYVAIMRKANGDDYFKDPENAKNTVSLLLDDIGTKIAAKKVKGDIFKKVLEDNTVIKSLDNSNIQEIQDRLIALDRTNFPEGDAGNSLYKKERLQIMRDLNADMDMGYDGVIEKAFRKYTDQVVDDFIKKERILPVSNKTFYGQPNAYPKNVRDDMETTVNAQQARGENFSERLSAMFGRFTDGKLGGGLFNEKAFDKTLSGNAGRKKLKQIISADAISDNFTHKVNTFVESIVAHKKLQKLKTQKKFLEDERVKAEQLSQDANMDLNAFDNIEEKQKIVNDLKSKLPKRLQAQLDDLIKFQNRQTEFYADPPTSTYGQTTELMVHGVIKKAKEAGIEQVIFPNVKSYDFVDQRGQLKQGRVTRKEYGDPLSRVPYNFAIGAPVTRALKKYGDSYKTTPQLLAVKKVSNRMGQEDLAEVGVTPMNLSRTQIVTEINGYPLIDDDLHRIVDLTKQDAINKTKMKIPRMAKGGILSRFRKAS